MLMRSGGGRGGLIDFVNECVFMIWWGVGGHLTSQGMDIFMTPPLHVN